jgi:hypothetical protein
MTSARQRRRWSRKIEAATPSERGEISAKNLRFAAENCHLAPANPVKSERLVTSENFKYDPQRGFLT